MVLLTSTIGFPNPWLSVDKLEVAGKQARQRVTVRVGLDAGLCQRLVKDIKGGEAKGPDRRPGRSGSRVGQEA